MKKIIIKSFLLVCLEGLVSPSFAAEEDFRICTVAGYYMGTQERFLGGLAFYMAGERGLIQNGVCTALVKSGHAVGESLSKTGKVSNQEEANILLEANEFGTKVYKLLSSKINF